MGYIKQYLSRNLFSLICGIFGALAALAYVIIFRGKLPSQILWEIFAFASGYFSAQSAQKILHKIEQGKKRTTVQAIFAVITTSIFLFCIYPLIIVILCPPPTEVNRHSICCNTPLDYGAQGYESVTLRMEDGVKISGWYIPSATHKDYLIIMVHGHWNDRQGTLAFARYLIKAGYPLFMYDQRGNGESEGKLDLIADLSKDLLNIREELKTKYSFTNFGALGLSMGAHTIINALHNDDTSFNAVWLDGLLPQTQKDFSLTDNLDKDILLNFFDLHLIHTIEFVYKDVAPRRPIVDILSENHHTKFMLVAGGNEKLESNANKTFGKIKHIQTWIIPNAGHITGPFDAPQEYEKKLVEFFESAQQ